MHDRGAASAPAIRGPAAPFASAAASSFQQSGLSNSAVANVPDLGKSTCNGVAFNLIQQGYCLPFAGSIELRCMYEWLSDLQKGSRIIFPAANVALLPKISNVQVPSSQAPCPVITLTFVSNQTQSWFVESSHRELYH